MISTLRTILKDNWEWRSQILKLAIFDLQKRSRGAVLGRAWLVIKPAVYVFCFWFALAIGLRAARTIPGDVPYFLWLCSGFIPWFYMQDMMNAGSDALHRYTYLVTKLKFPLSAISTVYATSTMIIHLILQVLLFIVYFANGMELDIHLIQVPFLLLLMFLFWDMFSVMTSQLSGMSRDFANLVKTFSTPMFWLSGIIFDISNIGIEWVQTALLFNPVTFFGSSFRMAFCYHQWIWENPPALIGFGIVFLLTMVVMALVYKRLSREVADVL